MIAARPGLGTIGTTTLLTIEAARAAGLEVRAVALTPWPGARKKAWRDVLNANKYNFITLLFYHN